MTNRLLQATNGVRQAIQRGEYAPGTVLPGLPELARRHGSSPATLRRALTALATEGVVKRVRRKGTLVQPAATARLGRVCLLLATDVHTNELFAEPIYRRLTAAGYLVDMVPSTADIATAVAHCTHLREQPGSNGVLVAIGLKEGHLPAGRQLYRRLLHSFPLPVIVGEAANPDAFPSAHWVVVDGLRMARDVMQHLLSLGHRAIAGVQGMALDDAGAFRDISELARHLTEVQGGRYIPTDLGPTHRRQVVAWARRHEVTAYWAITDHEAMLVMNELHRAGLRVPQDISLVGRNDTPWCQRTTPTLTSTSWNPPLLAATVEEVVNALLAGQAVPRLRWVQPILQVRDSTGPAPAAK
jgi:DNA-binding LacI/PurR family transcriptional regulator